MTWSSKMLLLTNYIPWLKTFNYILLGILWEHFRCTVSRLSPNSRIIDKVQRVWPQYVQTLVSVWLAERSSQPHAVGPSHAWKTSVLSPAGGCRGHTVRNRYEFGDGCPTGPVSSTVESDSLLQRLQKKSRGGDGDVLLRRVGLKRREVAWRHNKRRLGI